MKNKLLAVLCMLMAVCFSAFCFTACGEDPTGDTDENILSVYNLYVAHVQVQGQEPLTYEDWLESIKGEDGATPNIEISADGYWVINGEKTEYKAVGEDGQDGNDGATPNIEISADGYWVINGEKTEYKAVGKDGQDGNDGATPTIEISADGYWVINGEKTEYKAVGEKGESGAQGQKGETGATIEKVEFDEQGRLVITLTDGNVLPPIEIPQKQEHVHLFGTWKDCAFDNTLAYHVCSDCKVVEIMQKKVVQFDFKNGTGVDTLYVMEGEKITPPEEPTKESDEQYVYEFAGWTLDGKIYDFDKSVTDDIILVAKWEATSRFATEGLSLAKIDGKEEYAVVGKGSATDTDIVIPSIYKGLPVTSINSSAFRYDASLTSIKIGDNVVSIGDSAFAGCDKLTEVELPDSVTEIGAEAFSHCMFMTKLIIGNGVTRIKADTFYWCISLSNVVIGENVETIEDGAFKDCYKLVEVINNSKQITITKGGEDNGKIGYNALVVFNRGDDYVNRFVTDADGYVTLTDENEKILINYVGEEKQLVLPNDITKIYNGAFLYNFNIEGVKMPNSLTEIGTHAFLMCTALTSVEIPDNVTDIGEQAFYYCDNLDIVVIGKNVKNIGYAAFYTLDTNESTSVYYKGNTSEWNNINIEDNNNNLTSAVRYYYVEKEVDVPTDGGNYWHYVDGVPSAWTI